MASQRKPDEIDTSKTALEWKELADTGDAGAQVNYGLCLQQGEGVEQNWQEAARYFKLAADQNHPEGLFMYGICLRDGKGVKEDHLASQFALFASADAGCVTAQMCCGFLFRKSNPEDAAKYFKLAADQGDAESQFRYGMMIHSGDSVEKDLVEAARYFKLAADQGNSGGQYFYGECLKSGDGVEKNEAEAVRYIKMAADQGDAPAQYSYAGCAQLGIGMPRNPLISLEYCRKAAAQGYPPAVELLEGLPGEPSGGGDDSEGFSNMQEMKQAADEGDMKAQYRYGQSLLNGDGVEKDESEGVRYLKMAADQGYAPAQYFYARSAHLGIGMDSDPLISLRYCRMAADQGFPPAVQQIEAVFGPNRGRNANNQRRVPENINNLDPDTLSNGRPPSN